MAKSKEDSARELGYWYDRTKRNQNRDYENLEKAKKMKKRIDKLSGEKHIKK